MKDHEPERCMCKEPPEGELACGEGCINRSVDTHSVSLAKCGSMYLYMDPDLIFNFDRLGSQNPFFNFCKPISDNNFLFPYSKAELVKLHRAAFFINIF